MLTRSQRRRNERRRAVSIVVGLLLFGWGAAATWFAVAGRLEAARLADEQADLRRTSDERVRALTRRLVGVTSYQTLEQDGLAHRLADIISRQVELENRQSALSQMAERLVGPAGAQSPGAASQPGAAPPAAARRTPEPEPVPAVARTEPPARVVEPARVTEPARPPVPSTPALPVLRLGAPPAPEPTPDKPPAPRSSLDEPPPEGGGLPTSPAPAPRRERLSANLAELPLRDQFGILEASLDRVQRGQQRLVGAYSAGLQSAVRLIKAAIRDVGLRAEGEDDAPRRPSPAAKRGDRDTFDADVAALEGNLSDAVRWRAVADAVPFRAPLPIANAVTSSYGLRKDPFTGAQKMHAGLDFRSPIGTPVHAGGAGKVLTADVVSGYGNLVEIEHEAGVVTRYGHLSAFRVSAGQTVTADTVIGLVGSTGRSTGPHLHYETRLSGTAMDPNKFIQAGASLFGWQLEPGLAAPAGEDALDD